MKKIYFIIIIILIINLAGCKNSDEPPNIRITSGDYTIESVVGLNYWNGGVYDRLDNFKFWIDQYGDSNIKYIKIGEEIKIKFDKPFPDELILKDYILNEDGSKKYKNLKVEDLGFELVDGDVSFILEANDSAIFSSNSKDYEDGAVIRGFEIILTYDNGNECEYGFIIKTDAM